MKVKVLRFVDVVVCVGDGQNFALVHVVDPDRLQHLRLDEVADPYFGHHRNAHRRHDVFDHLWVAMQRKLVAVHTFPQFG